MVLLIRIIEKLIYYYSHVRDNYLGAVQLKRKEVVSTSRGQGMEVRKIMLYSHTSITAFEVSSEPSTSSCCE